MIIALFIILYLAIASAIGYAMIRYIDMYGEEGGAIFVGLFWPVTVPFFGALLIILWLGEIAKKHREEDLKKAKAAKEEKK